MDQGVKQPSLSLLPLTLVSSVTFLFSISFLPQKVSLLALFTFLAQVFLLPTETNLFYIATQGVCVCVCMCMYVCLVAQSCPTLCNPMDRLLCPWGFSRQEYWSGLPCPPLGIFPTQESNPSFPHCRQILYHLSHQGSPIYINIYIYKYKYICTYIAETSFMKQS